MKPERHEKSWGYEDWLVNNAFYCGKLLIFRAGGRTSMHHHVKKHETMFLRLGKMLVRFENHTVGLEVGECVEIQRGQKHQLIAVEDSELIEVSTHHEDSDSYRD